MAQQKTDVITVDGGSDADVTRVPKAFGTYVSVVKYMTQRRLFEEIASRFRINRQCYQFVDAVVGGLALLSGWPEQTSWHGMLEDGHREGWASNLAALANRADLPTQASMSRLLDSIPTELALEFQEWLFDEVNPTGELLDHPSVTYRDCEGKAWQVWGLDGRVQAFRRRGLVEGEAYPPPRRSVDELGAESGYAGRKRADVQMMRTPLQHLGTGTYEWMAYEPGNGSWSETYPAGLEALEQRMRRGDGEPSDCMLVCDGESEGRVQLWEGMESPVHFVTRTTNYEVLERPEVRERLAEQRWEKVVDGGSGPTRWATELGTRPVGDEEARLVVSRFRSDPDRQQGAGRELDGYHYEVYATDLGESGWPSRELVQLYYGRAGREENRFRMEDRHVGLDRMFSKNDAAQQVIMALGMWMENVLTRLGVETNGGLEAIERAPTARDPEVQEGIEEGLEVDGELEEESECGEEERAGDVEVDEAWWGQVKAGWATRLADEEGWSFELAGNRLICPNGQILECYSIRWTKSGKLELRYRVPAGPCDGCPFRSECTSSTRKGFKKERALTVEPPEGDEEPGDAEPSRPEGPEGEATAEGPVDEPSAEVSESDDEEAGEMEQAPSVGSGEVAEADRERETEGDETGPETSGPEEGELSTGAPETSPGIEADAESTTEGDGESTELPDRLRARNGAVALGPPDGEPGGDDAIQEPLLSGSTLRQHIRECSEAANLHVEVDRPPEPEEPPDYYDADSADRQHRRMTWEERHAWNALPDDTEVQLTGTVPAKLKRILPPQIDPQAA